MVWNMYDFFSLYADVDEWEWNNNLEDPSSNLENPLDAWIVSRVHQLNKEVDRHMQAYDISSALKPIIPFIDDASNWFVRRSRKRFWKSEDDSDKQMAYRTLHYVLVQLSILMAPFTPFMAEELYRKLTGNESVHLLDWPEAGHINEIVVNNMDQIRLAVEQGLAERAVQGIKVRQPLSKATVYVLTDIAGAEKEAYEQIVAEELNVKSVDILTLSKEAKATSLELDTRITPELRLEGLMREVVRNVQQTRKQANLQVDDRIDLKIESDDTDLNKVLNNSELSKIIKQETLAINLDNEFEPDFSRELKIDDASAVIHLKKANS
jgi:isoleucyl-tRNA synthetase